jgi:hypothetical protein
VLEVARYVVEAEVSQEREWKEAMHLSINKQKERHLLRSGSSTYDFPNFSGWMTKKTAATSRDLQTDVRVKPVLQQVCDSS